MSPVPQLSFSRDWWCSTCRAVNLKEEAKSRGLQGMTALSGCDQPPTHGPRGSTLQQHPLQSTCCQDGGRATKRTTVLSWPLLMQFEFEREDIPVENRILILVKQR